MLPVLPFELASRALYVQRNRSAITATHAFWRFAHHKPCSWKYVRHALNIYDQEHHCSKLNLVTAEMSSTPLTVASESTDAIFLYCNISNEDACHAPVLAANEVTDLSYLVK